MIALRIVLVIVALMSTVGPEDAFLVVCGKQITVKGSTSVGEFTCTHQFTGQSDTLFFGRSTTDEALIHFAIPVKDFACGNVFLNKDFQRTLNAKTYPVVEVSVLALQKIHGRYTGKLKVRIAGKEKIMDKVIFTESTSSTRPSLHSVLILCFSDFALETPRKLGGIISVEEQMEVSVELFFSRGGNHL